MQEILFLLYYTCTVSEMLSKIIVPMYLIFHACFREVYIITPVGRLRPGWQYDRLLAEPIQYGCGIVWAQVDGGLRKLAAWCLTRQPRHLSVNFQGMH